MDLAIASSTGFEPDARGHRILACIGRTPRDEECLAYAISLARALASTLTLVHVMQPRGAPAGTHTDALDWEIARQDARTYVEGLQRSAVLALGRPVAVRIEQGHAAERIVALGGELGADLTVLGSHHARDASASSLGSTVQQVVAVARGSVFIAHAAASGRIAASVRRIIVPLDGSLRTESVLPIAVRVARGYHAELVLVHLVEELAPTLVLRDEEDLALARRLMVRLEANGGAYLEGLRARLARDGLAVRTLVARHANPRRGILETSARERADLIIVSAHGAACDAGRMFGSVAEYVLAHATAPLLILQDLQETEMLAPGHGDEWSPPLRASYAPELA